MSASSLPLPGPVSREAWEAFLQYFTHEIRNKLNGISLEAADIAEQASGIDASRLQQQMRECSDYLRFIRNSLVPDQPELQEVPVVDLLENGRGRFLPLQDTGCPVDTVRVDAGQIVTALTLMLEDLAQLTPEKTALPRLEWIQPTRGAAAFRLSVPMTSAPLEVETWGRSLGKKTHDGLLGRYTIQRLLEQNGGGAWWSYDGQKKALEVRVEFGVIAS